MTRRTRTLAAAGLLALTLGVLGATLPVPMVALGPGPTYDTLGAVDGRPVIAVDGLPHYPTSGHLNMTTVSVTDGLTLFTAVGRWAARNSQVVQREALYPSDRSPDEIRKENEQQFTSSEANAEAAALGEVGVPVTVVVSGLVPGSPAAAVLQVGDELISVDGGQVSSVRGLTEALSHTVPGQSVPIIYRRAGGEHRADVVLTASPDRPQGLLGVLPTAQLRSGDITISLAGIGGPSAGLMFALSVVDKLTPGELTGGRFIAGTGAISGTGDVSAINGIPFKMMAAREAGATVFLVPAGNCGEAVATAPDGLQLVRVQTLRDAVESLTALQQGRPAPGC